MPLFDVFRKKKKEDQPISSTQNYSSAYQTPANQSSQYSAPKTTTMVNYGQPKLPGVSYIGGQTQPKTTIANAKPYGTFDYGQQKIMLPGGGLSSGATAGAKATMPASQQPQQQPQQPNYQDQLNQLYKPTADYLANQQKLMNERKAYEEQQRAAYENAVNQQFGLANEALRGQIPELQQGFDRFRENQMAGLSDLEKAAIAQKGNVEDYYGDAQRQAAQAAKQAGAQTMQKFAAQGAIDSAGAGSHLRAQENVESEFNRTTQQFLRDKASKLSDIDTQLVLARRNANDLIGQEESKLRQTIAQINQQLAGNEIAKGEAIRAAYAQTQQNIFNIQDQLNQLEYQGNAEKMNLQQQLEQMMQSGNQLGLSPEFLQTGVPQTEQDYIYRLQNPTETKAIADMYSGGGKGQGTQQVIQTIDDLLGMNYGGITQGGLFGKTPKWMAGATGANIAQNTYDQLKSLLSLENIQKLKGTGAITDREQAMLSSAASRLNTNLTNEQFAAELQRLRAELAGEQYQRPSLQSLVS